MLKTSHISASATSPSSWTSPKTGGTGSGSSISKPTSALQAQQVQQPAAGDVREPADVGSSRAQQLEHRAHVDHGRLEQRVGDRRAAERRRPVVERAAPRSARARERVAVGVQAGARAGRSARRPARSAAPVTIASSATVPKQAAVRSKPFGRRVAADQLGQHRDLAAGDLDAGRLGAAP